MEELYFLKLGGSLITDKDKPHTARLDVIRRLAEEISEALQRCPERRLILGHGSGSFGHAAAHRYGTRHGVSTPEAWKGFAEVWKEARLLNQIVVETFLECGLPVIAFPPSACIVACNGKIPTWDLSVIQTTLEHNLIPLVFGDVVFDTERGGGIL